MPEDLAYDICVDNFGQFTNSGSISLNGLYNFGAMENTGSIANKIVLEANMQTEGSLTDTAGLTDIYNGVKTENGGTSTWTRAACEKLSISPTLQYGTGGETVSWKIKAETADPDAQGVRYYVLVFQGNGATPTASYTITANEENTVTSPTLPWMNGNAVYRFQLLDGLESVYADATVKVTSSGITAPAAIKELVYTGKEQTLTTSGATTDGTMLYRLGETGTWVEQLPTAKDAGTYKVYYKLSGDNEDNQLFVESTIAKKPVTISGTDASTKLGSDLAELSYTVSGLVNSETLSGIQVSTDANKDTAGEYKITVSMNSANPNYEITMREGKYTVTADAFNVVAKDKYGVFSDEATYTGFNIELTVPQGATAYYSTAKALTKEQLPARRHDRAQEPALHGGHAYGVLLCDGRHQRRQRQQAGHHRQGRPDRARRRQAPHPQRNPAQLPRRHHFGSHRPQDGVPQQGKRRHLHPGLRGKGLC